LLASFLLLLGAPLRAETVSLDSSHPKRSLNATLEYLEDPSGQLRYDDVAAAGQQWQRNGDTTFNRGFSSSVWWLRLRLHNPSSLDTYRMLELGYALLDYVDFHVVTGGNLLEIFPTGDRRPFDTRPVDYHTFVLPLRWGPRETLDVYIRLQSSSALQAPVTLWQPEAFYSHAADTTMAHGLYYGAMSIMVVYNLLVFLVLRVRSYLYYVGFITSGLLFFMAFSGQGYRNLWTDQVALNDHSVAVFMAALVLFANLFTRSFIGLKAVSPRIDRLIAGIAVCAGILLALSFLAPYQLAIMVLLPFTTVACVVTLSAGSIAWYRGVSSARFFVIAWTLFLLGTIALALQKVSILPANALTEYAVQFGSALEAVLLSFAMADRISTERRLRSEAQEETIRTARRLNEDLERRVEMRTSELAELNATLLALSNTDQLTQLHNRRYLEKAGGSEWRRCERHRRPLSVLIIDVDFFKSVNDRHGHLAGDDCLRTIGEMLKRRVRFPPDIVARYGGEEFCLILPETELDEAACVAERLRQDIEDNPVTSGGRKLSVTVSIGLHATVPGADSSLEMALKFADTALYKAKAGGRNRVETYHPTDGDA